MLPDRFGSGSRRDFRQWRHLPAVPAGGVDGAVFAADDEVVDVGGEERETGGGDRLRLLLVLQLHVVLNTHQGAPQSAARRDTAAIGCARHLADRRGV